MFHAPPFGPSRSIEYQPLGSRTSFQGASEHKSPNFVPKWAILRLLRHSDR